MRRLAFRALLGYALVRALRRRRRPMTLAQAIQRRVWDDHGVHIEAYKQYRIPLVAARNRKTRVPS